MDKSKFPRFVVLDNPCAHWFPVAWKEDLEIKRTIKVEPNPLGYTLLVGYTLLDHPIATDRVTEAILVRGLKLHVDPLPSSDLLKKIKVHVYIDMGWRGKIASYDAQTCLAGRDFRQQESLSKYALIKAFDFWADGQCNPNSFLGYFCTSAERIVVELEVPIDVGDRHIGIEIKAARYAGSSSILKKRCSSCGNEDYLYQFPFEHDWCQTCMTLTKRVPGVLDWMPS